jgi:uncharacterized protein (TIGR02594 family)
MNVKELQEVLNKLGHNAGAEDGLMGRVTLVAIKKFQKACGLNIDGIVGPATLRELSSAMNKSASIEMNQSSVSTFDIPLSMTWMHAAHNLIDTKEVAGEGANETIMSWAEDLELTNYTDDDIPWCGLFVGHCVGSQLADEVIPVNVLGARKWQHLGVEVTPKLGAILVFWRGSPDSWKGHVGFYWAEDDEAYHVLGGNQSNTVNVTRIAKSRLLTARWPSTAVTVDSQMRLASVRGQLLSTNEA